MDIFDRKTICEICFNGNCSDKGIRNIHRGYNPKSCASFKGSEDEVTDMKKCEHTEADDLEYSTHYDADYYDSL